MWEGMKGCMYVHVCVCMCACMCMYACMSVCVCVQGHVCVCMCMYVWMYFEVWMYEYVQKGVSLPTWWSTSTKVCVVKGYYEILWEGSTKECVAAYLMVHVDDLDERTQSIRFKLLGNEFLIMVSQYVSAPTTPIKKRANAKRRGTIEWKEGGAKRSNWMEVDRSRMVDDRIRAKEEQLHGWESRWVRSRMGGDRSWFLLGSYLSEHFSTNTQGCRK